jgi:uncharacterized repeat protein (TIGR01451 family)
MKIQSSLKLHAMLAAISLFFLPSAGKAAIHLSVEANPNPVKPNETIYVAITIGNSGDSPSGAITLDMLYPEFLNTLSSALISDGGTCPGGSCTSGEFIAWDLGSLSAGGGKTVTLIGKVSASALDGTSISFDAEVSAGGASLAIASQSVVVRDEPVFDISVDENIAPVSPGQSLTYSIRYTNRSVDSASGTTLSFPLPEGTSFMSATGGGTLGVGEVEWDLQTFPPLQDGRQKVTVTVGTSVLPGTVLDVDAATIFGEVNLIQQTSSATASTRVARNSPLSLRVEMNPNPVQQSETVQTDLTVTNIGSAQLIDVTLQMRLPEFFDLLFDAVVSDGGTCPGGSCTANEFVTWDIGNLQAGTGTTVTLPPVIAVLAQELDLITFTAKATESGGQEVVASSSVVVKSEPAFDIAIDDFADPVSQGKSIAYHISYTNRSLETASNTVLSFPLPDGAKFLSASGGGVLDAGSVVWDLQTFPAQQNGRQTVTVSVEPGISPGSILQVDSATISGTVNFVEQNSSAMASTRVESTIPLSLSVETNPNPVQPGESIQIDLSVANRSTNLLFDVALQMRFPQLLSTIFNSNLTEGGVCPGGSCSANELVTWDLGNLSPGAGVTVSLAPVAAASAPELNLITFNAKATESGGQGIETSRTLTIQSDPPFSISLDDNPDPAGVGSLLTYTVNYSNRSAFSVLNPRLLFPLPKGVTFWCATGDATVFNRVVEWDLPMLDANRGGQREITVSVDSGAFPGTILLVDSATISGQVNLIDYTSRAMESTRVENNVPLSLVMDPLPNPVMPGETIQVDITVTNIGSSIFNPTLQVRYPDHLNTLFDASISDGGFCPGGSCSVNELVTWNLPNLPTGASITVNIPPVVSPGTPEGAMVGFKAAVNHGGGSQTLGSVTALVGQFGELPPSGDPDIFVEPNNSCGGNSPCFSFIQNGILAAISPCGPVKVAIGTYTENPVLDESKTILFQCGWASDFTSRQTDRSCIIGPGSGGVNTKIDGPLTISGGTVIMN